MASDSVVGSGFECVICFEQCGQRVTLPCDCKVGYCAHCWDNALASSFRSCHQPRCPTCRMPVRVDVDAEKGCLVFSRETEVEAADPGAGMTASDTFQQRTLGRLIEQAKPVQVALLRQYGERHPVLVQEIARNLEAHVNQLTDEELRMSCNAPDMAPNTAVPDASTGQARLLMQSGGFAGAVGACWTSSMPAAPPCVCGSSFRRISGKSRFRESVERELKERGLSGAVDVEVVMASNLFGSSDETIAGCDLCGKPVTISQSVWTCVNGNSTILHTNCYDVCDACFVQHACSGLD